MVSGKAVLLREDFCDGLGDCLPQCPTGAITFVQREAPAYDEAAVRAAQTGCPGSANKTMTSAEPGRLQSWSIPRPPGCKTPTGSWPPTVPPGPTPNFTGSF